MCRLIENEGSVDQNIVTQNIFDSVQKRVMSHQAIRRRFADCLFDGPNQDGQPTARLMKPDDGTARLVIGRDG